MLKRLIGSFIVLTYAQIIVNTPLSAYALTGRQIVSQSQSRLASSAEKFNFATKLHLVKKDETIALLCKRYNLTKNGFAKLNKNLAHYDAQQALKPGSLVVVPLRPLSDAMSHSLDKGSSNALSYVNQGATILSNSANAKERNLAAKRVLVDEAGAVLASKASSFLNQYGTAQISLAGDDKFSFANSQFAILLPLYDKGRYNFFTQVSYHKQDKRYIGNLGFGERYFADNYMVGANAFLDYDYTKHFHRYGFGVEYGRDYLKASANIYLGQNNWHYHRRKLSWDDPSTLQAEISRPAQGWDARLQAYLPSAPQLGGKLMFEQYYGDQVALFGEDNLQKDPYAVTLGLDYTPVPLFSFDVDYKRGKESKHEVRLGLNMNYHFGVPLGEQLNQDNVSILRSLAGSRYDLVDRNNDIILSHKSPSYAVRLEAPAAIVKDPSDLNSDKFASPEDIKKYHMKREANGTISFDVFAYGSRKLLESTGMVALDFSVRPSSDKPDITDDGTATYHFMFYPAVADSSVKAKFGLVSNDTHDMIALTFMNIVVKTAPEENGHLHLTSSKLVLGGTLGSVASTYFSYTLSKPGSNSNPKICFAVIKQGQPIPSEPSCQDGPIGLPGISLVFHKPNPDEKPEPLYNGATLSAESGTVNEAIYTIVPYVDGKPKTTESKNLEITSSVNLSNSLILVGDPVIVGKTDVTFFPRDEFESPVFLNATDIKFKLVSIDQSMAEQIFSPKETHVSPQFHADFTIQTPGKYKLSVWYKGKEAVSKEFEAKAKAPSK